MKNLLAIFVICCLTLNLNSQDLSFKVHITSEKITEPMIMKVAASGTKMVMEMQQMTPEGNMKFLIDNASGKQYILMDMNGQKMAMAFNMKDFEKSADSTSQPKITFTKETRTIGSYKCTKVIAESDDQHTDIWATEAVGMQYAEFFKMMSSVKSQNPVTSVPELKNMKGFPIEIITTDKKNKTTTTLKISEVSKAPVNQELFSMKGYQVMDAPVKSH